MANNLISTVAVIPSSAYSTIRQKLEKVEHRDPRSLAEAFFDDVQMDERGRIMMEWAVGHLGPKWTFLENVSEDGFELVSSYSPPIDFFTHLVQQFGSSESEMIIKVKYQDEGFEPVGALAISADSDGSVKVCQEEDHELEDPRMDMDEDDDEYETAFAEFLSEVEDRKEELLESCLDQL